MLSIFLTDRQRQRIGIYPSPCLMIPKIQSWLFRSKSRPFILHGLLWVFVPSAWTKVWTISAGLVPAAAMWKAPFTMLKGLGIGVHHRRLYSIETETTSVVSLRNIGEAECLASRMPRPSLRAEVARPRYTPAKMRSTPFEIPGWILVWWRLGSTIWWV